MPAKKTDPEMKLSELKKIIGQMGKSLSSATRIQKALKDLVAKNTELTIEISHRKKENSSLERDNSSLAGQVRKLRGALEARKVDDDGIRRRQARLDTLTLDIVRLRDRAEFLKGHIVDAIANPRWEVAAEKLREAIYGEDG